MADLLATFGARGFATLDVTWALTLTLAFERMILPVLLRTLGARLEVRPEERTLVVARLAEQHKAYGARVPRWLGRPTSDGAR